MTIRRKVWPNESSVEYWLDAVRNAAKAGKLQGEVKRLEKENQRLRLKVKDLQMEIDVVDHGASSRDIEDDGPEDILSVINRNNRGKW